MLGEMSATLLSVTIRIENIELKVGYELLTIKKPPLVRWFLCCYLAIANKLTELRSRSQSARFCFQLAVYDTEYSYSIHCSTCHLLACVKRQFQSPSCVWL